MSGVTNILRPPYRPSLVLRAIALVALAAYLLVCSHAAWAASRGLAESGRLSGQPGQSGGASACAGHTCCCGVQDHQAGTCCCGPTREPAAGFGNRGCGGPAPDPAQHAPPGQDWHLPIPAAAWAEAAGRSDRRDRPAVQPASPAAEPPCKVPIAPVAA